MEFLMETSEEREHLSWISRGKKAEIKRYKRKKPQEVRNHGQDDRAQTH